MQDRPTARELIAAVRGFLEHEVVPALEGRRRFHALVAVNLLAIVDRELAGEETALLGEWASLVELLGRAETRPPERLDGLRAAVRELNEALAERIRRGDADRGTFRTAVRAHVRAVVREKLGVANPRVLEP